jgi:uncharacterized protein
MAITLRKLVPGDEALTDRFLATTPETTIFLRSNLARAGFVDDGAQFSGTYAGAFEGNELAGVAAVYWNSNLVVSPGPHAEEVAAYAVETWGKGARAVGGIFGRHEEVTRVRAALSLAERATRFTSKEILYVLPTGELVVPEALARANGAVECRVPRPDELDALLEWRMAYCAETMSLPDTPANREAQSAHLAVYQAKGHHFVLTASGERVAYSAFNATVGDVVQIGGVWTPPELRARGHARCVVAGSLQHARDRGVRRAVLFTGETNPAAQAAYVAIGFRPVGDYAIILFE